MAKNIVCSALLALLVWLGLGFSAAAAPPQGVTVFPALVSLAIPEMPDANITVKNNSKSNLVFTAQLRGVVQAANGKLVPSDVGDADLLANITVNPSNFTLPAGKSINLRLHAQDAAVLSGGGHYASLLIKQEPAQGQVALAPAVNVTVFVVKEAGAVRSLAVSRIAYSGFPFTLPKAVTLQFMNTGNTTIVPRAHVSIVAGRSTLAAAVINDESIPVLPRQTINVEGAVQSQASRWWPSRVTMSVSYRFDGSASPQLLTKRILYIPLISIAFGVIILFGGVFAARYLYQRWKNRPSHTVPTPTSAKSFDIIRQPRK